MEGVREGGEGEGGGKGQRRSGEVKRGECGNGKGRLKGRGR